MNILLVGEMDSDNLGDRAIYVSLKHLFESLGHSVRGWDLSHYRYTTSADNPGMRKRATLVRLVESLPDYILKYVVFFTKKRAAIRRRKLWQEEFRKYDLIVFGGGALLMDNNWSFPLALVNYSRAVRAAGRPYVCIGCSTGTNFSFMGKRWLREFLDGCAYIALRDPISIQGLLLIGNYNAEVYVDSALTLAAIYEQKTTGRTGTIGLNVISLVRNSRLPKAVYDRYMSELIHFIHAVGDGRAGDWKRIVLFNTGEKQDFDAAEMLLARLDGLSGSLRVETESPPETLEQLCKSIGGFDLVISTRMHSGILAKSFGRPLIAVGWDEKVRGFCEMVGIGDDYIGIEECRGELLVEKVRRLFDADLVQPDRIAECLSALTTMPVQVELHSEQTKEEY